MGSGFLKKKKQAREMQNQIMEMQSKMQNAEATGSAGNGLVTITLSTTEIKMLKIKPECVDKDDIEGLEDLIKAAYKDAAAKLEAQQPSLPPGLAQGLPPGLF
ncbi:MAG: YbaB/EbfC family nucleoid-associated protein [Parachlamydiaceae bacterium]|nr:YbaB/EbfC family nucleoid-associated protein [Parachlamydiaceae bacterium]